MSGTAPAAEELGRGRRVVLLAYLLAGALALAVGAAVPYEHPIAVVFAADLAATVAVFAFSRTLRNSSFYDAYWSVAPIFIALYFALVAGDGVPGLRQLLVLALVAWWGVRLTWNWLRSWTGLDHEDWRYLRIQEQTGALYWPVSFLGIHLLPTLWVFAGCLPLYPALASGTASVGWLDALAVLVTGGAIALESRADSELLRYRRSSPPAGDFLRTGVWAWSRHPNYLGEMGFWWGLWLFGLAAAPSWWWTGVGALSITLMFRFVSLPLIETRMRERRPGWEEWAEQCPLVLPRPPG